MFGGSQSNSVGIIERAFKIAREGNASSVTEIRDMLMKEGHGAAPQYLTGPTIGKQLRAAIAEGKKSSR